MLTIEYADAPFKEMALKKIRKGVGLKFYKN
jgi:hypothetical protein